MSLSLHAEVLAGRYRLQSLIASGGMGEVWRAADLVLDRAVAVKVLRAEYARQPETVARFRAEARHAAGLSHPAIAQVYDFGEGDDERPAFLVMELIAGQPLTQVLAAGPLRPARVLDLVAQVAAGLAAAHAAGVVHRDIKPGNLIVDGAGTVKITDFGIAYALGSDPITRTGTLIGTPAYLAPERVSGQVAGPASDLYSLGMVAYECLAGGLPFTGTAMEIALAHRLQPLPPLPATVPPEVAGLIASLTATDPARRPASAAAVAASARALRDELAGPGVPGTGLGGTGLAAGGGPLAPTLTEIPSPPADRPPRGPAPRRRRRRVLLAATAIAIVASLAGWALASGPGPASPPGQGSGSHSSNAADHTVTVDAAALVGRPVPAVARELRGLGLRVTVAWQPDGRQEPGTVLSVRPAGQVLAGATIFVTGAARPGHRDHGHGDHGDHGGGGNGGGD